MKKIMFNDKYGLTQAVLEGRKTQTRRLINPTMFFQRLETYEGWSNEDISAWKRSCNRRLYEAQGDMLQQMLDYALSSSHYKVGEEIAVAQSYSQMKVSETISVQKKLNESFLLDKFEQSKGWGNKMFVEAKYMLHRIKISNIRVERLQDISEQDCLMEGIKRKNERYVVENEKGVGFYTNDVILAFRFLVDNTCGRGIWEKNPYVFVYDFDLIK